MEIVENCLRNNGISDVCVDFVKTGLKLDECLMECTNIGYKHCLEKVEACLLEIKVKKTRETHLELMKKLKEWEERLENIGKMEEKIAERSMYVV